MKTLKLKVIDDYDNSRLVVLTSLEDFINLLNSTKGEQVIGRHYHQGIPKGDFGYKDDVKFKDCLWVISPYVSEY